MFELYQTEYAKRHSIPSEWILKSERLELAAFLEWQVKHLVLSLPDARRRYVNEYPDSNRQAVSKKIVDEATNTYEYDSNYARGSVLSMIIPYNDSIREVRNVESD